MMRRVNDGNNTLDTINAAAFAIASSQNRLSQPSNQKKKWGNWLNITGCFGYQKNNRKRIGHAVLVPETTPAGSDSAANVVNSTAQAPPSITLPFIAPPSSPASLFQSEPPSTAQSPVGLVSKSMYSPGGPNSIFAIGPYAHETQLVSPPVFSASSTAPFTPPPESVHLTTPSSPEVPFAQLFDSNNRNSETFQRFQISHHDFQNYQFQPGSPVGPLISPRSAISGNSSPLPDEFQTLDTAKLLKLDKLSTYGKQKSNRSSGSITPDTVKSNATQAGFLPNHQWVSDVNLSSCPSNDRRNEISVNHRVSFELSAGKVPSSVENKPPTSSSAWNRLISSKFKNSAAAAATDKDENVCDDKQVVTETLIDTPKQTKVALVGDDATVDEKDHQSLTLSSSTKEFNFNNAEGGDSPPPNIVADWWANEKVAGNESGASKDWSFFPVIQPGLS
ncbi:uncharacterized protein At1g76660 [Trifolium pratense]|uniref:uncharacterized protein At1g76660 n=1 Tax=Trifolium pratense TaxID=57577 RepID=UPI001E695156|nr:uncharacterized protein At1g76660 [Trifolium pratense]